MPDITTTIPGAASADTNADITSANAELVLTVADIFPAGISLQMFSTSQSYTMPAVNIAQTQMGVDGKMVSGYLPSIYSVTITLQAASPSRFSLSTLWEAMSFNRCVYQCGLVCTLPSVGQRFVWSNGVLRNGAIVPTGGTTLGPTTWAFDFETLESVRI
jgi:hypothetical protein